MIELAVFAITNVSPILTSTFSKGLTPPVIMINRVCYQRSKQSPRIATSVTRILDIMSRTKNGYGSESVVTNPVAGFRSMP